MPARRCPFDSFHAMWILQMSEELPSLIVTDLIYRAVQVLRENLYWIRISAQDAGLMEPVEPWDEG